MTINQPGADASFYVTAIDGPNVYFLDGPYATKQKAEAAVEPARAIACDYERNASAGRAWFMAYGVSRARDGQVRQTALGAI